MSKGNPKHFLDMALHSICQPGLPSPQGESQPGSFLELGFQRTKSLSFLL